MSHDTVYEVLNSNLNNEPENEIILFSKKYPITNKPGFRFTIYNYDMHISSKKENEEVYKICVQNSVDADFITSMRLNFNLNNSLPIEPYSIIDEIYCNSDNDNDTKIIRLSGIGLLMFDCVYRPDVVYYNNITKSINIPFYEHTYLNLLSPQEKSITLNIKLNEEWELLSSNISNINNDKSFDLATYLHKYTNLQSSINNLHENNIYIKFLNLYNILVSKNKQIPFDSLLIILQKLYDNYNTTTNTTYNMMSLQGEAIYINQNYRIILRNDINYTLISQYHEYSHLIPNNIDSTQNIIRINSRDLSNDKQIFKGDSAALLICCFNKNNCIVDAIDKYELSIQNHIFKLGNWSDLYIHNKIQYKLNLPQPQNFQAQGVGAIFFGKPGIDMTSIINSTMNFNKIDITTLTLTIKPEYIKDISKIHILNHCLNLLQA
jgi:hypothetical protein